MSVKSKPLLRLRIKGRLFLSDKEKRQIISDYLTGSETKRTVYNRHTGYDREHGKIGKWMKEFRSEEKYKNWQYLQLPKERSALNLWFCFPINPQRP